MFREHRLIRTSEEQLPAEFSRARSQINDAIRRLDCVRIVFHDEDSVPEVAQRFQNIKFSRCVSRG